jgi:signal peptidase I
VSLDGQPEPPRADLPQADLPRADPPRADLPGTNPAGAGSEPDAPPLAWQATGVSTESVHAWGAGSSAPTPGDHLDAHLDADPTADSTGRDDTAEIEAVETEDTSRRGGAKPTKTTRRVIGEWVVLIVAALAIAFLIKTFLFQAFYIPSESMVPTLDVGDRVLVNKLSYDFHDVHRGDIVVFDAPPLARSNDIKDLVKRVIGLPGETVTYPGDGHLYINGRLLKEPYLPKGTRTVVDSNPHVPPGCGAPADGQPGCTVPAGHIFVMGDNRPASKDARFFGSINESSIVGRVFLRIWPISRIGFM